MCCRRRQARCQPFLTAGHTIYNASQDHHATRQLQQPAGHPPSYEFVNMQPDSDQINSEVLKGAGIDPPPYSPMIMNRTPISPDPPHHQDTSRELEPYISSDDEIIRGGAADEFHTAADGLPRIPNGAYRTKKELKAAYKAVRNSEKALYKAEKAAVKVERKNSKAARKGCCC